MTTIYTIGHSTHPSAKLLELLSTHSISAIADVRSSPYSRMNPQFNREPLRAALKAHGIAYVFLGKELGARSDDPDCYVSGKVQYDRIAQTAPFEEGLKRVRDGAQRHRLALMCAEKDPLTCHRTILVCRHLAARSLDVQHILEDGKLEKHDHAMSRLLAELGLPERDLFRPREGVLTEAYRLREQEIAYTIPADSALHPGGPG